MRRSLPQRVYPNAMFVPSGTLLNCGCVKAEDAEDSVFYGLSAPWLLQLEGIVDEMLIAALKGHRASLNYD
jgi:hypothetical protein